MFYEPTDLKMIVSNIINIMMSKARSKNIQLLTKYCSTINEPFCTDSRRVKQILFNLIGNAIKFTDEGFVKIEIKNVQIQGKKCLEILVKDTGIGMATKDMKRVF